MGNHTEQLEGNQPQEAKAFNPSLSNYGMERQDPGMNTRDLQMKTGDLVAQNLLPDLSILENVKPYTPATRAELKEAGIKCDHQGDAQNSITTAEFPNGVKVIHIESKQEPSESRPNVKVDAGITVIEGAKEVAPTGSGKFVDATGKQVAQVNADGSVTVEGKDGQFYTVHEDGAISKQAAIRNRDGSFRIIDDRNPLGEDQRPGDVVKPEKKKH